MKSKVTVEPSIEPVTRDELKEHLRITSTSEDSLLDEYIKTARIFAEDMTGRKFITQTLVGYVDDFSGGTVRGKWWSGVQEGTYFTHILNGRGFIEMDWAPAQSITSIETIDRSNVATTYDSANYYLDNFGNDAPSRIELNDSATIPTSMRDKNAIKVTYVAGYGSNVTDVPSSLRHAVKLMASTIYSKRGDCDAESCSCDSGTSSVLNKYAIARL